MSDLPPRPPPRIDGRREQRYSQTSMWLVFLVLAAVILAAIAFTVNRPTSVTDPDGTSEPATTGEAPVDTGMDTVEPTTPAPGTTGGTTQPAP
jgi:hypothetical protein